ncbi:MAG: T9SS type A sorting domain-containing protein, partial [Bacteroidota bacterium]
AFSSNGCSNSSVVVTVLPSPQINPVNDQILCAGTPTMPINFSGTPGATYSWTNSNTSIGLAPSGNGNIPSFITQNYWSIPTTAVIVVTPSVTTGNQTCVGAPQIFTITVHPIPVVIQNPNQVVCCQNTVPTMIFTSNLPGVTANWSAYSSSPLLLGYPSSGTGNIPSFTPINNSLTTEQINFIAVPTSQFGCIGLPESFTVSVLPCNIFADQVSSIAVCNGSSINGITFTGNATSFSWVNTNVMTGIPTSGTASIPGTTLSNNTNQTITSQIIVIPEYFYGSIGCTGNTMTFDISTYPTPQVDAGADQTICNGESTDLAGNGASNYSWSNGITDNLSFSPTSTQTYVVQGTDANGCVNIDSVTVIVNDPTTSTLTVTTCDSYTLNGQTFTSSGIYSQIIPNAAGCDSTITLDLTLNYSPNTPIVTIENEVNLSTSNNTGVTYQWTRCPDYVPIVGQTNSSFNPTINGLYAVVATNGCGSDTSDCADVSTIGFSDLMQDRIQVYPNPNNGEFSIEIPSELLGQLLHIVDINGRLIKSIKVNKLVNSIDILDLARGSYWLQMDSQQPIQILKQ